MSCQYALVEFKGTDGGCSVSVVPVTWLDGETTFWPSYSNQERFNRAVIHAEKPGKTWEKYSCRVMEIKGTFCYLDLFLLVQM